MKTKTLVELIWEKAKFNLKSEAANNNISYAWWVVEPILHMCCYYLLFEVILSRGGSGYVYFLLVGLVPWLWFSRTFNKAVNSLLANKGVIARIDIPKLFFPSVVILESSIKHGVILLLLLILLSVCGFEPNLNWLYLIPLLFSMLLFMIPVCFICAYLVVIFPDVRHLIAPVIQILFFFSGVFYDVSEINSKYGELLLLNPLAGLIYQARVVLIHNQIPDFQYLFLVAVSSFMVFILTVRFYLSNDKKIAKFVLEL